VATEICAKFKVSGLLFYSSGSMARQWKIKPYFPRGIYFFHTKIAALSEI
jgi:hypothetical protein